MKVQNGVESPTFAESFFGVLAVIVIVLGAVVSLVLLMFSGRYAGIMAVVTSVGVMLYATVLSAFMSALKHVLRYLRLAAGNGSVLLHTANVSTHQLNVQQQVAEILTQQSAQLLGINRHLAAISEQMPPIETKEA